ncbi:MAG: DUF3373 domain-containing protein, partial [Desulfuromonadaceae bacterium]|nr:DUF3373 domain-containing protein [Desulfuromonadaceae bacterium]
MDDFFTNLFADNYGAFNPENLPPGIPVSSTEQAFAAVATHYPELFSQIGTMMGAFGGGASVGVGYMPMLYPKHAVSDINNDIAYTTRLRLNMKAKVYDNVDFSGRLAMYKGWGDSTGVKVFDSWDAFTQDGTDGGNTTGDFLRVERAYFNWKDIGGTPFYLSIGRRPSTYGSPSQYRENEMRGGTPSGHLVHFNFDGITVGYDLGDILEGMNIRFCYGQGFESEQGNGEMFNNIVTKDTHLGGFNIDILADGTNFIQLTAFAAQDVNDGFKGTFAFPTEFAPLFAPTMNQDMQNFPNMNFVTRYQPSTVIGDMKLIGLGLGREEDNGIKYFASLGYTELKSNGKAGMFGGMGSDNVYKAVGIDTDGDSVNDNFMMVPTNTVADDSAQDGYGVYVGVQVPAPMGKVGFEYNYGSKYWTPFTQAQDDMLGSKLAVRGEVYEAYYIFDVNPRMSIKLGGLFYDYAYTGSGSPVGAPQK